ncbi:MAG TPA: endolytic transglycosylase MltG [Smithellaceae bacterium]|nr:endolytic transglycosylase MltG [Smithellaceae bacterium]
MKEITIKKRYYIVLFLALGLLAFVASLIDYSINSIDNKNTTVVIDIPTGSGFFKIAEILNQKGMVKNRLLFYALVTYRHAWRSIRAGEYEFSTSLTPYAVIDKLLRGEIKHYKVFIPEDSSVKEIAAILMKDKLIDEESFFEAAADEEFLKSLDIQADYIEGYLFPDTYYLERSMNTRQIMRKMVDRLWNKFSPAMLEKAKEMSLSVHALITLASIIGKESGNNAEKPLISAVFHNRLKRKMPLQSDPTAVYDLENFTGAVKRSHLKRNSPYNTYVISGLPPGPIANPGLDSMKAALYPAKVDYLYFVAQGDGSHFFSSSLEMHNKAIARYRLNKGKRQ